MHIINRVADLQPISRPGAGDIHDHPEFCTTGIAMRPFVADR